MSEEARILAEYRHRSTAIKPDRYSMARPAALFTRQNIQRHVIALLARHGLYPLRGADILEVGCGYGARLDEMRSWGADPERLRGIDLNPDRVAAATRRVPMADIREGSAADLPWPDHSFDLVLQSVVFTSILDADLKGRAAQEMLRVLQPGGLILWYDFRVNNPRNQNVRGIGASEIRRLFPGCSVRMQSLTLAPPLAELIAPLSWTLAHAAESLPFLRTHLLAAVRHG